MGALAGGAEAAPDLIVVNGDVYTVDPGAARVEAFAVEDGKFTVIGSSTEVRALADRHTTIIDAGGNTVLPGIIDGHSHVSGNSPAVAGVDLSYVVDKDEWLLLIEQADQRMPEGEWMTGGYWDHTLSDAVFPTKEMLNEVAPDRPILLNHIDGHYSWANTLALDLAEITADTPVPPGGEIEVD
ncbi:MAG: amidohydrolase family protein, partial [Myxococcota bacterium]